MLLDGVVKEYPWGSTTAIPAYLGLPADPSRPIAEVWFGAHPTAPSPLRTEGGTSVPLNEWIECEPTEALGQPVQGRFGALPFLLKLLAPGRPVSLQVHPHAATAEAGFAREEAEAVPLDAPHRTFKDRNHKPEMIYALTPFQGLVGFRSPAAAAELMAPIQAPLARRMDRALSTGSAPDAMREALALTMLARGEEVAEFVWQCRELATGEPSPGPYSTVAELDSWYPQDAGAAASLLLSRVQLSPGECVFVGAGVPHAYLSGLAAEIMANSDNVLRAGLTTKHVDLPGLLESVDTAPRNVNQPPERLSPSISRFAPPVEEFALAEVDPTAGGESVRLAGPLIALAVHGKPVIDANGSTRALTPGSAMFLPATTDRFTVAGTGRLLLAYCPSA